MNRTYTLRTGGKSSRPVSLHKAVQAVVKNPGAKVVDEKGRVVLARADLLLREVAA